MPDHNPCCSYDDEPDFEELIDDDEDHFWGLSLLRNSTDLARVDLEAVTCVDFEVIEWMLDEWTEQETLSSPGDQIQEWVTLSLAGGLWLEPQVFVEPSESLDGGKPLLQRRTWPLPIAGSPYGLGLVLREWVQIADMKLAKELPALPGWNEACCAVLGRKAGRSFHQDKIPPSLCQTLSRYGLPGTPDTVRWLLAREESDCYLAKMFAPAAPSRGLLVQTFCLYPRGERGAPITSVSRVDGFSEWAPATLHGEAVKVIKKHDRWWKRLNGNDGHNYRPQRGRQAGGKGQHIRKYIALGKSWRVAWNDWTEQHPDDDNEDGFRKLFAYTVGSIREKS